ncbi:tRNA-dihydrouridine synthase family protein [Chakrabartyella piscis]|uniref:tRNA dihydrouridine synthase n=1 Tax=Chakrabartyella piscis TaxID=2918914 RepID=UPI0029586DE6|nr:tRNA-dihydrouridine synthase family protein [Chakrabartyella piscis]
MKYYVAPLEGVTGNAFRNVHHKYFPGVDKYYMPFITPTMHHRFSKRDILEVSKETNQGLVAVPQILTKSADDFIWAMEKFLDYGYDEINLNVGCPSATVVSKGKGSGLLRDLEHFDQLLEKIFNKNQENISIKTRIGIEDEAEFHAIMEVYNRYPIKELIIHPRLQQDFYKNPIKIEAFQRGILTSKNPVCYNGDILTKEDVLEKEKKFPQLESLMIGRGIIKNPSLISGIKGDFVLEKSVLEAFHNELFAEYTRTFESKNNGMMRMKELWSYMAILFVEKDKVAKKVHKCKDAKQFTQLTKEIFEGYQLCSELELRNQ